MRYGQGQMLGSSIDPRYGAVDFSPYINAANVQAQSVADMGKVAAGGIDQYAQYKKQQDDDEKVVMKARNTAKAISELLPDLKPMTQESIMVLEDRERPISERKAMADSIAETLNMQISEIRNKQQQAAMNQRMQISKQAPISQGTQENDLVVQ